MADRTRTRTPRHQNNGEHPDQLPTLPGMEEAAPIAEELQAQQDHGQQAQEDVPPAGRPAARVAAAAGLIPNIDLAALALPDDYQAEFTEGEQVTVSCRKATGAGFFRAHPELHRVVLVFEVKEGADRGFYLAAPEVARRLTALVERQEDDARVFPARLTLCYSHDTGPFLWPIRLPRPGRENQQDDWANTALRACKAAESAWVKMFCPRGASCYKWRQASGELGEPRWPNLTLDEMAGMAFQGRFLQTWEDPVIRRWLGEER